MDKYILQISEHTPKKLGIGLLFSDASCQSLSEAKTDVLWQDVEHVKCMSFHPTGDYLVVGTNHPVIRMYDFNTGQCYVCNVPSHQHTAAITSVK